jgi:hypothetical protein
MDAVTVTLGDTEGIGTGVWEENENPYIMVSVHNDTPYYLRDVEVKLTQNDENGGTGEAEIEDRPLFPNPRSIGVMEPDEGKEIRFYLIGTNSGDVSIHAQVKAFVIPFGSTGADRTYTIY